MLVFEPFNDKRVGFNPEYPDEMEKIIEYVESLGKLNVNYKYLEQLWYDFSDIYEAGFLTASKYTLAEFVQWITGREV